MTYAGRPRPAATASRRERSAMPCRWDPVTAQASRRGVLKTVLGRALAAGLVAMMGALVPLSALPTLHPMLRTGIVWLGPLAVIISGIAAGRVIRSWWAVGVLPIAFLAVAVGTQLLIAGTAALGHVSDWMPVLYALPSYLFLLFFCVAIGVASGMRPGRFRGGSNYPGDQRSAPLV